MKRYAAGTEVPVEKTRGEIIALLRSMKCDQLAWADSFQRESPGCELRFVWTFGGGAYVARFRISYATDAELLQQAKPARQPYAKPSKERFDRLVASRGRVEHRGLLIWLRAMFNAVDLGIITAEQVFMPWLVTKDGQTIYEKAAPLLPNLVGGGDPRFLLSERN